MQQKQQQQLQKFLHDFLIGGTAGIVSKTICAPIERVKLLIQTQGENEKLKDKSYNGIVDCFRRCIKEEGFLSLWRGNGVNVVRYFPTQALNFSFKDLYGRFLRERIETKTNAEKLSFNILCGGMAGSSTTMFVHPLDFARTRIGVDLGRSASQRQFNGLSDCLKKTYAFDGVRGLYRGLSVSVPSIFMYRGLYFGIYDTGKEVFFGGNAQGEMFILKMIWAQISVILAETLSYPGDTIKRKFMMQSMKETKSFTTIWSCCQVIYQKEGLVGFWRGSMSNILRGVGSSLCLIFYDELKHLQEKRSQN